MFYVQEMLKEILMFGKVLDGNLQEKLMKVNFIYLIFYLRAKIILSSLKINNI